MKLVTFMHAGEVALGALDGDSVVNLSDPGGAPGSITRSMLTLLDAGPEGLQRAAERLAASSDADRVPIADVVFLPPVPRPGKVIALGRNYAAHAAEGGAKPPAFPMLFHKTHTSLTGHEQPIIIPTGMTHVDYEGELAVVIGRTCKNVRPEEALAYVAGYAVANDVSEREFQKRTSQFASGKMIDTFGPIGPALVTADEIDDVQALGIRTRLNGAEMQSSNTRMMIFDVAFTISYISRLSTLEPGDIILTGTPEGVGFARTPPVYLQSGDVVEVEIDGVGLLRNPVVAG